LLTERNDHYRLLSITSTSTVPLSTSTALQKKTDILYQPLQAPKSPLKHRFNHLYDLLKSVEIEPTHATLIDSIEQKFER
jgi:hypothetical protein